MGTHMKGHPMAGIAVEELSEAEMLAEEAAGEAQFARIDKSITDQHDPKKFRIAQWIKNGGVTLAREDVVLYTDLAAGWEVQKHSSKITLLRDQITKLETDFKTHVEGPPAEEIDPLRSELEDAVALREQFAQRVVDTQITFRLRAIAPIAERALINQAKAKAKAQKWNDEDRDEWYTIELFKSMIIEMELGTGEIDDSLQTHDDMSEIIYSLPDAERSKLYQVQAVLMNAIQLADSRESAGFPGGSADVGAER